MSVEFAKMQQIFLSALEQPQPEDRDAYLDQACAGDDQLRNQVELLLKAHVEAGSVPGAAVPGQDQANAHESATETAGAMIGPYKLLEEIGEGGMGTVWMAQQTEPVKRVVALKLIKAGMDSKQVIARFEAERQALALMDHPNIARVFDGGAIGEPEAQARAGIEPLACASGFGRPYFVMELVKGIPITKYCDEHHLTPRQRLELFIPICQAVQHAHQKGIIHRDLKPSNVLVALYDGKPVPKVIDFGVAKAAGQTLTEQTLVTGFGNIVGTLEYMSPEQAELNQLDIDTRSDIYSLGVLLYELLTGSTPFTRKELEKAGMLEMLRVIREQEPSRPSTKLSTAEGLPTLAANRGTEPAKLTKLVRGELDWIVMKALEKDRNRRYETANGFAMDVQRYLADEAVLACPPSVGYRFKKFARRNKSGLAVAALVLFFLVLLGSGVGWAVRDRAAREAEAARERAERQMKVAGQVELIFADVDQLMKEQKWDAALAVAQRAEAAVTGAEADAATAEQVRERLRDLKFIGRLEQIRMERTPTVEGRFDSSGTDWDYAQAFRDYGVDVEVSPVETSISSLKARPAFAVPLAGALDDWVFARRQVSEGDAVGWMRLVAVARGIDPEPLRDRLRSTWGRPVSEVQDELRELGESIDVRSQHPATLYCLARTLRRTNKSAALRILRDAQYFYPGEFWLNFELAFNLNEQRDHEGATRFYTAAVAIRPQSATAHSNLGNALGRQKKLDEAVAAYRMAINLDPRIAATHNNFGLALRDLKKLDEAAAEFRIAIELDPKCARAFRNLGNLCDDLKDYDEAVKCFRKSAELEPTNPTAHYTLGRFLHGQKKLYEAIDCYRKAIALDSKHINSHAALGNALRGLKKPDEAIVAFKEVIHLQPNHAHAHLLIGCILRDKHDYEGANAYIRKALKLQPEYVQAHLDLGLALGLHGKLDEAIAAYEEAIRLQPDNAHPPHAFGCFLRDVKKDYERAIAWLNKASKLEPKNVQVRFDLGSALARNKDFDRAIASFRKVIELDPKSSAARYYLAATLSELAWAMATHPEPARRDPARALSLAKEAVELNPKKGASWNTLGAAHYRVGDWKAAIAALEKSMELRKGGDSQDWFFLAMAHWQLGDKDKARQRYDQAVNWMDKNQPTDEELRRFRAEAAELLELKEKK